MDRNILDVKWNLWDFERNIRDFERKVWNYEQNIWYFDQNVGDFEQNIGNFEGNVGDFEKNDQESSEVFAILRKMCDIFSRMFGILGKCSWYRANCSRFWAKYLWF